jgi:hypothetical protein
MELLCSPFWQQLSLRRLMLSAQNVSVSKSACFIVDVKDMAVEKKNDGMKDSFFT